MDAVRCEQRITTGIIHHLIKIVHPHSQIVSRLKSGSIVIAHIGFEPVDYGTLAQAVVLDHMVPLMIRLDSQLHASSRKSSFRLAGP